MQCPYCQQPVNESTPVCPACSLCLDGADSLFGRSAPPATGFDDRAGVFSPDEAAALRDEVADWMAGFPQVDFTIATAGPEAGRPLSLYAFWLFNRSAARRRPAARGDGEFGVLLVLEAEGGRAALTVGYGLEPFAGGAGLQDVLEAAGPALRAKRYPEAVRTVLRELAAHLRAAADGLADLYGVDPADWTPASAVVSS